MAEISMGNLPHRLGDTEEQRTTGGHVSINRTPGLCILPEVHPEDGVSKTVRAPEKSCDKCCKIPATDACDQPQRS